MRPTKQLGFAFECGDGELILTNAEHGEFGAEYRGRFVRVNYAHTYADGPTFETQEQAAQAFIAAIEDDDAELADTILALADPDWRFALFGEAQRAGGDARIAKDYAKSYRISRYAHIDIMKFWQLEAAVIRGRVVDAVTGQPISDASIKSQLNPDGETRSAADGSFEVMVKPDIVASLVTEHPNYQTRLGELPEGQSLTLAAGEEAEVELTLTPNVPPEPEGPRATVVGQIVDVDSQQPIADMEVTIVPAGKESLQVFMGAFQTVTDADGQFTIADLPVGKAMLVARKANPIYHHTDESFQVSESEEPRRIEAKQLQAKEISVPMPRQ